MKILFFGDYSNLHACLANELRKQGHEVCVISDGGRYMDTAHDILLDRKPGKTGAFKYLLQVYDLIPKLKGYDVVQLINPHFLSLKPGKIKYFFKILRRNNRSVFLTLAGNDYHFVHACLDGSTFRFSEFMIGEKETQFETTTSHAKHWLSTENRLWAEYLYPLLDGAMSVLPEYDIAARPLLKDRLAFTNIPIQLESLPYHTPDFSSKLKIFIGMRAGMEIQKGTAILQDAALKLQHEYPDICEVETVRNLPLNEYLKRMAESHILLDQLYSYSPGTNAFQAMALGPIAATGAQPEYFNYINRSFSTSLSSRLPSTASIPFPSPILSEHNNQKILSELNNYESGYNTCIEEINPIIPLSPLEDPYAQLETVIFNREKLPKMSLKARKIVETNNDVRIVASKFVNHWNRILK